MLLFRYFSQFFLFTASLMLRIAGEDIEEGTRLSMLKLALFLLKITPKVGFKIPNNTQNETFIITHLCLCSHRQQLLQSIQSTMWEMVSGQNPPGQNPPGQNPPDKIPLDKIPPRTKSPQDKIPLDKIPPVYFIFY